MTHSLWVILSGHYQPMLSFAGSAPSEIQFSRTHSRFASSRSSDGILCGREWWTVSDSIGSTIPSVPKFTKSKLSVYWWVFLDSLFTIYVSQNFKNPYHMFWFIRRNRLRWSHCGGRIASYFSRYLSVGGPISNKAILQDFSSGSRGNYKVIVFEIAIYYRFSTATNRYLVPT